jgi:uncharacterized protein YecT (DUF1311 family)
VRLLAAAILMFAVAGPALAAPPSNSVKSDPVEARYTPAYDKCLAAPSGQSTMGMIDCTGAELQVQDARLNTTYRKTMASLNARQKAKLQAAQRAWVAFRDAECASYEDDDWGTLSRINASACVLHMTVQRTMDLEAYPPAT